MSRKSVSLVDDEDVWDSFSQVPEVNTLNVKTPKTQRKRRAERQSLGNLQESWTEETRKSQNKILLKSNSFVWKIFFWRSQKMIRLRTTVGTGWSNSTRSLDLLWRGPIAYQELLLWERQAFSSVLHPVQHHTSPGDLYQFQGHPRGGQPGC